MNRRCPVIWDYLVYIRSNVVIINNNVFGCGIVTIKFTGDTGE